jgi:hypothetical protein
MARLGRSIEEYESECGWSSALFAGPAVELMRELMAHGVQVSLGRTVVHIATANVKLKAYVHHNGRTHEWATITDFRGNELESFYYDDFHNLRIFLLKKLELE